MNQLVCFCLLFLLAVSAWAGDGRIHKPVNTELIPDQYIVVYEKDARPRKGAHGPRTRQQQMMALGSELSVQHGALISHRLSYALHGSVMQMSEAAAKRIALDPRVAYVEQDSMFYTNADQTNPPAWGIDRIDERTLPLDNNYRFDFDGSGVDVYVIDTGIRTTHQNFTGRASFGAACIGSAVDDNGHGTHVAGTAGSASFGVAKNARLIAVKVCTGGGSCPNSAILCGVDYVTDRKLANPGRPAVANMSLGGGVSSALNNAVNNSVAAGVFYAVAAGNDGGANACNRSPASASGAFTVGSSTINDRRSSFSNIGNCVDVFAPGSSIASTWNTSNTSTRTISGTSMASPHVAGAAALILDQNPNLSPAQVASVINSRATSNELSGVGSGSPNRLLYTLGDSEPPPPVACTVNDSFENGAAGWSNAASSTCSTGSYVLGNPTRQTNGGVTTQVGGAQTGNNAIFTANNTSAGNADVDGGNCVLRSPNWTVNQQSTLSVSFFHGQRDTGDDANGDFFELEYSTDGGGTWNTLASNNDSRSNATWTTASATIAGGSQAALRMQCSDGSGPGDLVECGIDDLSICPE